MRGSSCLVVLCLGGCAQLAGIDKTNADNRRVTLALDRISVGAKVETNPLVLDGLTASFLVPDDADATLLDPVVADPDTTGLWAAKIPGDGTPPVLFTLPDTATYLYALPSRTMHSRFVALEHPDPVPPPAGATIDVTSPLDTPSAAGETFDLLDVGTWVAHPLPVTPPAAAIAATFAYANGANLAAPLPLAGITPDDVILVMRHAAGALTGVAQFTPAGPQDMATAIATPVVAVAQDQTLAMPVDAAGIAARFTGEKPAGGATVAMSFDITAAPGFASGVTSGPSLLSAGVPAAATSLAGTYGNPFAATQMWPAALAFTASKSRTYAPAGGTASTTLGTSLTEVIAPDGATPISVATALPLEITVGITPLDADDTSVLIDASKPVPVTFTTDGQAATLYELELIELVANGTTFTQTLRLALASDSPSWSVPQGFLLPAHHYLLRAVTISGAYGDLTTGDVSTVAVPYMVGVHDGGVFTVTL